MAVNLAELNNVVSLFTTPEPPTWNEDYADFVTKEYERRRKERRPWELQWRLNLAFLDGKQFLDINTVTNTLEEVPRRTIWEEREVFNQIEPIVRVRHSKLSRIRPVLKVRPASGDRHDVMTASVASKLLAYVYNEQSMREKLTEAILWSEVTGNAFLKHIWDPRQGRTLLDPDTGEAVSEGDIAVTVHSPFEIYPETPWCASVKRQRSLIHARAYHVDEIEELWGIKVEPEDVEVFSLQPASGSFMGGFGYGAGTFKISTTKLKRHAVVKEYWELPSSKYRGGRLIVVVGRKTVHAGSIPFLVGDNFTPSHPFVKLSCLLRPGVFWDKAVVEPLIPVQRRYNSLRNRVAEYLNRAAIGQIDIEDGAYDLADVEDNAAAPGHVFVRAPGRAPIRYVDMPSLPETFYREENTLMQEFIVLSGVSEIAKQSQAPPGVKSGVALSIALEQDDTRLAATAGNVEIALIEAGKQWLRLYKQFASFPRVARYVGRDNTAEVFEWDASTIRSDDVIVEGGTGLVESLAQRRQMVFDLVGAGVLDARDPAHRRKLLELLEFGHWEFADDDSLRLQAARAERENAKLTAGEMVEAAFYDDHAVHAERHLRFILSAEFEEIEARSPDVAQAILAHLQSHLSSMAAQVLAQPGQSVGGSPVEALASTVQKAQQILASQGPAQGGIT